MHLNKASRPDSFNLRFYQKFWDFLGDDIYPAGLGWFEHGTFPSGLNSTVITFIPMCMDTTTMKDLRPIALLNMVYKIVTKVLANRLKVVLPNIIYETQLDFIKGRSITDNVLIAF